MNINDSDPIPSATTRHVGRALLASSIVGGLFLWCYTVTFGGALAVLAVVFFFVSVPVAVAISLAATAVLAPLIAFARRSRHANVFSVAGMGGLLPTVLWASTMYQHVPTFLGRLAASWWVGVWVACMAGIYWLVTSVEHEAAFEANENAP